MSCPLFVELCAGTAAVSLRLAHPRARPPVSRMGAKTGYADVILRCLGLRPGQRAEHYLWCEPDAGVRLLLHAYTDRKLALAAADIIRSWKDEEPRALWERLRAEGPAVCPPVDAREVARLHLLGSWAYRKSEPDSGFDRIGVEGRPKTATDNGSRPRTAAQEAGVIASVPTLPATIHDDARTVDPREVARWAFMANGSYRVGFPSSGYNRVRAEEQPPSSTGGRQPGLLECLPPRFDTASTLPATIHDDARTVDPREVARYARILTANRLVNPDPVRWKNTGNGGYKHGGADFCTPIDRLAAGFESAVEVGPSSVVDDARTIDPPQLPPGTVAYADVPYKNTTGYAHLFPRSEWLPVVRRWREAGALVVVSEAEPIPDLMAEGWHAVEITGERRGQKRTFSKQKSEWLTMSEPPKWRPSVQVGLFGAVAGRDAGG